MIDSVSAADVADAERFVRIGVTADAQSAARTRDEFARWLADFFELDAVQSSDLLLATNEALANAAEFAYLSAAHPGTMDLQAWFDADKNRLTATISDRGTWRPPNPSHHTRLRGRGIPLMEALTDHASIETSSQGTQVCLEWAGVDRSDPARMGSAT